MFIAPFLNGNFDGRFAKLRDSVSLFTVLHARKISKLRLGPTKLSFLFFCSRGNIQKIVRVLKQNSRRVSEQFSRLQLSNQNPNCLEEANAPPIFLAEA